MSGSISKGSGKTSVMKMIQSRLGEKILPIWFNTWQFSQFNLGNSLAISMIDILLKKLDGDTKILRKITGGMFSLTKNFLISATELTAGSNMGNKIKDLIENFSATNCVNEINLLKKNFEETVEKKLNSSKKSRVVVFVDDLDRLEPLKAIELLEVLKLFLDCKNCVFVLAVDYEIVTLGIRQKYGDTINAAKGKSYFEKIIQLPFKMPVAGYDIKKYTDFMMKKMSEIDEKSAINFLKRRSASETVNFEIFAGYYKKFGSYFDINDLLSKKIGEFKIPQKNSADTMSTAAVGDFIFDYAEKKYQFRYVLDSNENKFTISVYVGAKQDSKKFLEFMGENPLEYEQIPETDKEHGWYFYDDIFEFDMNNILAVEKNLWKC